VEYTYDASSRLMLRFRFRRRFPRNNDFFLDPTNPSPSYSFTGLNGSFRSPNMSTVPLGSYTSRTPLSGSYGRERMSQMRKEAEFVSVPLI
jgi:hypothetical protein